MLSLCAGRQTLLVDGAPSVMGIDGGRSQDHGEVGGTNLHNGYKEVTDSGVISTSAVRETQHRCDGIASNASKAR